MSAARRSPAMNARLVALAALTFFVALAVAGVPAQAATPSCDGERATQSFGDGDDSITGTQEDDVIVAGGGDDTIHGLGGDDRICAGDGDLDLVDGGPGDDRLFGEDGVDGIIGSQGEDLIDGGSGDDTWHASLEPASADQSGLPFAGLDLPTFLVLGLVLTGTWLVLSAVVRFRRRHLARPSA